MCSPKWVDQPISDDWGCGGKICTGTSRTPFANFIVLEAESLIVGLDCQQERNNTEE